jgi:enterochelin esterase-like enzyme
VGADAEEAPLLIPISRSRTTMRAALALAAALFLPLLLSPVPAAAQVAHGVVKEGLTVDSRILGRKVRYTVYLPPDYDRSSRYYPVVYLLHGYTDDDTGWLQFGEADRLADEAIADGTIPPMILVMPDAGVSWYIDNFDGSVRYEDFFFQEFIPFIESHYRIRAEKRYRGVAGLSMGGFGSLVYGLRHPDMFAALAGFSSAVYTDAEKIEEDDRTWARVDSVLYGPAKGQARINETFTRYSPLHFLHDADPEKIRSVGIYLDVGDDDFLYRGNAALHVLLRDLEIPHEYRVRDGAHTWTYWRTGLIDGLRFIGGRFHQE